MTIFRPPTSVADRPDVAPVAQRSAKSRIAAVDRLARGAYVVSRIGPVRMPDRAAVVDALFQVLSAGPEARLGLLADRRGRRWHYDPSSLRELSERMVTEEDGLGELPAGAALELLSTRLDPALPVTVVLSGEYLLFVYDHGVVDSRFTVSLPGVLLSVAAGGALPSWIGEPVAAHPLRAGLVASYLRKPSKIPALVDARQAVPRRAEESVTEVPWQGSTAVEWATADSSAFGDIRRWARTIDPRPSFGAVIIVMVRRALAAQGIALSDESDMIYDVRNFLPAGTHTHGNFITGIPVTGGDDLDAVAQSLRATAESARPLAALAAGVLRETILPRRATVPDSVSSRPRARVVLSNIGISRQIDDLPWVEDGRAREAAYAVHPIAPEHVALQLLVVRGTLQVTLSFNDNVFDREAMARALAMVTQSPLSLLEGLG